MVSTKIDLSPDNVQWLIEQASAPLFFIGFDGKIRKANSAAAVLLASEAENLSGSAISDLIHPEDQQLWSEGLNKIPAGSSETSTFQTRIRQHTDKYISLRWTVTALPPQESLFLAIAKQDPAAELELSRSEENFRILVESVPDYAIFMMDPDGTVVSWNSGAQRIVGFEESEIVGQSVAVIFTPEDRSRDESQLELERARQDGRSEDERWHLRKDGTRFFASGVVTSLWDPGGQHRGFAKIMRDITERKANDEAMRESQKLKSIGLLAGGVAHDFNNLLTGIIGGVSLVLDNLGPAHPDRSILETALTAGRRAADLTRQLLAYSGKGQFILKPVDISTAVSGILELIRASIPEKIRVDLHLRPGLPTIEADPSQIQQIVMNLVLNASEAISGEGEIVISTNHRRFTAENFTSAENIQLLAPGEYIVLEVRDTGEGMTEETQAKIFDPFYTTKFAGRGLGLAAVSGIVRSHKGSIQVTSARHRGSTFRVYLPTIRTEPSPDILTSAAGSSGAGLIMVVDDDEQVRSISRQALERRGFQVITANNGKEALECFESRVDEVILIILDMAMPVMSGDEAHHHLKSLRPTVPILVTSGYSELLAKARFGPEVAETFIQKPYTAGDLWKKVDSILNNSRPW